MIPAVETDAILLCCSLTSRPVRAQGVYRHHLGDRAAALTAEAAARAEAGRIAREKPWGQILEERRSLREGEHRKTSGCCALRKCFTKCWCSLLRCVVAASGEEGEEIDIGAWGQVLLTPMRLRFEAADATKVMKHVHGEMTELHFAVAGSEVEWAYGKELVQTLMSTLMQTLIANASVHLATSCDAWTVVDLLLTR